MYEMMQCGCKATLSLTKVCVDADVCGYMSL